MKTRRRIEALLERMKSRWMPSEEDKIWQQWVDFQERKTGDLEDLLKQPVKVSFKRRAIFLLLVPDASWNPIYWTGEKYLGKFNHKPSFLKELSPELSGYAAELICEFIVALRPLYCEKPKCITKSTPVYTIYMQFPDKYDDALLFYNRCILNLMALLPDPAAERAMNFYSIRDISTYCSIDDASGYEPLQELFHRGDISEKWKYRADARIREIIRAEISGSAKPREKWEGAAKCYSYIVASTVRYKRFPYSVELFADQLEFLISDNLILKGVSVDSWDVSSILKILAGDTFHDLRIRLANFLVFHTDSPFTVYSEETEEAAKLILAELGDRDPDLRAYLESTCGEYRKLKAETAAKEEKSAAALESLIKAMQ